MFRRCVGALVLMAAVSSSAQAQVLTFDDIPGATSPVPPVSVGNFYAGSGIELVGEGLAVCARATDNPSCARSVSWGSGPLADAARARNTHRAAFTWFTPSGMGRMNMSAGFTTGFSFFYSNAFVGNAASVAVYSGLDGTGSLLASLDLLSTQDGSAVAGCFGAVFCDFSIGSLAFAGTARSVVFDNGESVLYDDITFGATMPGAQVPEPATLALLGLGLAGLGVRSRRRLAGRP